ncbi:hypothetical protein ACFRFQ_28890 [Rhodococcus sp. NPDC056743]|uniref:hypothetical protein n=1 Tax=Rhodococcus sp. NPDC056743 TaxID=3345934 RepID=UPI003670B4E7
MSITRQRSQIWDSYRLWNKAVAEVIYPVTDEAVPAYMDLEADDLHRIGEAAQYAGPDARVGLSEAVRAVTIAQDGAFSLERVSSETRRWRRRSIDPPPCLAFLALTVLAAEEMGNSVDGLAQHAYYARLARMLALPDNDAALRRHYQRHSEFLWNCVNTWLENLEGERGLPTAYALTHRYVGLPMSQALVREGDRRKLPSMFAHFGLSPGMRLAPEDVSTYLGMWLTSEVSVGATNLRKLWQRADSHDRIAAIAAVELANWDGVLQETVSTNIVGRAMLVANLRTGFMSSSLDLSLGLRSLVSEMDGRMEVLETAGKWTALGFNIGTAGLWRTTYTSTIDFGSMLDGLVRIRHSGDENGLEYKRFPRKVVPLIYDELQSAYVQSERLQLGANSLLLVRTEGTSKAAAGAVEEVERILGECARPGFSKYSTLEGLPQGWTLFADIQLFGAPTGETKFNELVPLARNQLTVSGGLRIPSRIRKWSTLGPPEIRATSQSEAQLRVTLSTSFDNAQIAEWTGDSGTVVVDLKSYELGDGDYQVALFTGSKTIPTQQVSLRLRSSNEVDSMWDRAVRLVYSLDTPLGALTASQEEAEYAFVSGLLAEGKSGVVSSETASSRVFWIGSRKNEKTSPIRIGTPDPNSCVVTGAHYMKLPPAMGDKSQKIVEGECKYCGLVKRYPSWFRRSRLSGSQLYEDQDSMTVVTVADLPAVVKEPVNWDGALDALMHLGGGPYSSLQSVATQLEGSALFVDTFTRRLEALGHISIERNERWQPIRWEISPSCLALEDGTHHRLTGFWPPNKIEELIAEGDAASVHAVVQSNCPSTSFLNGIGEREALRIADAESATVVRNPGNGILETLPRLSEVAAALPRIPMLGFDAAERFDLKSASWLPSGDPSEVGAYRIRRGFEVVYLFRSSEDLVSGHASITSVHLAKHLAANAIGKTFATYFSTRGELLTPRGCELPGLYDRAAVSFSGELPAPKKLMIAGNARNCLSYNAISQASADLFITLLTT